MWKKWVRAHLYTPLRKLTSRHEISRYVATAAQPMVNIGCGKNFPAGWLNTDLYPHIGAIQMNAAVRWPVPPDTFAACICEHVIEHVPKPLARAILEQAFRAMKPDGVIRLVTPNLEFFAELILGRRSAGEERLYVNGITRLLGVDDPSRCDLVNLIFYEHQHRYIFTPKELSDLLASVGFIDIVETKAGIPNDPVFNGVEGHSDVVNFEFNVMEAFALEARKPARGAEGPGVRETAGMAA